MAETPVSLPSTSFTKGRDGVDPERRSPTFLASHSKGRRTSVDDPWEVSTAAKLIPKAGWHSEAKGASFRPQNWGHRQWIRLDDSPTCQQPEPRQTLLTRWGGSPRTWRIRQSLTSCFVNKQKQRPKKTVWEQAAAGSDLKPWMSSPAPCSPSPHLTYLTLRYYTHHMLNGWTDYSIVPRSF